MAQKTQLCWLILTPTMFYYSGPAFVETYAGKLYRECGAKAPRRQTCPDGTKERVCAWCKMREYKTSIASNTNLHSAAPDKEYCLKCMEDESDYDGYCGRCRDEFGDMHRHGKEWFVSFENSIKIPAKAFPGCMAFFDKRTKREWFVPSSSIGYTYSSFTAPLRLMSGWSWYNDAWGDAFLVNEDKQLAVRQSLLDIPSSTWQHLKEQLPGWRRADINAPVDGYTHTTTGIFLEACPVTDETLRDNPLPEGWVLVYDSRSSVPRFCNYYKNAKVFTSTDPRLTHVQWRPRSLPDDWRLVEEAGRCRFLPPNAKFLSNVPPHVHDNELDRGQIPITISPQAQNATRPSTLTSPSSSAPATPMQQHESRPVLTPASSSSTLSASTSNTLSPTSTNNSTSSVTSSVPPKKLKLSKTEIMRLCLQGLSIGVQVGTAVAGMPINLNLGSLVPMSMTSSDAPVSDSGASYSTDTYVSDYQ
ncbi:hypothetical protein MRB53_041429 [Persea americana]|nr:hypothetical protein MRB53_041429 [Persea americana]